MVALTIVPPFGAWDWHNQNGQTGGVFRFADNRKVLPSFMVMVCA
jgi:hypothetical protein